MPYQVLARKYRPQTFEEVVGQEAVVETLKNAISSKRLHHAYLFAGARGIGKTSLARIFAKALNCEKGPVAVPCNQCSICKEITEGTSLDVHEIDGASNTSVDDVRELREGLKYLPASCRSKIYIIDEVHMLSGSAFNALLKTLEEPPPHVLFFFATTEVHKIPATILSRCQRFDLRRIPTEQILQQLHLVCEKEKVPPHPDALLLLAREAEGSLRDSQSLLDQAIAYSNGKLNLDQVASMLGLVNFAAIHGVTEAVLKGETEKALKGAQEVYEKGHDLKQFALQWLTHWRNLLVYATTKSEKPLLDYTEGERSEIKRQSSLSSTPVLDMGFHLLHRGVEDIARSEFPKILLDVLVVRLSKASELVGFQDFLEQVKTGSISSSPSSQGLRESSPKRESVESLPAFENPKPPARNSAAAPPSNSRLQDFIRQVSSKRPPLASLIHHVKASSLAEDAIYFQLDPGIYLDLLNERKPQLEEAAESFFGSAFRVVIQASPLPAGEGGVVEIHSGGKDEKKEVDPIVSSAVQILNARIEEVNP